MKSIKLKIKRLSFHFFLFKTKLHVLLHKHQFQKKIGIVSSNEWMGKIKDDVLLKCTLEQMNVQTDIISWQDSNIDIKQYDVLLIRTIWGFPRHLKEFQRWLKKVDKANLLIMNGVSLIEENLDKEKQFEILKKYHIKHVDTSFLSKENIKEEISKIWNLKQPIVIKPTISESGNDTYVVGDDSKKNSVKIEELDSLYQNCKGKLMVQPFMEEVKNGEYSLIFIDGVLLNAVLRYPSIFTSQNSATYMEIEKIDKKLLELSYQILKIPEYQGALYVRIDAIKTKEEYQIMEVELIDPDLFLSFIPDKKQQKEAFHFFAQRIVKRIDKNQKNDKMKS